MIEIDNYMAVTSEMSLSISSLKTPDGDSFQTDISITGNTANITCLLYTSDAADE